MAEVRGVVLGLMGIWDVNVNQHFFGYIVVSSINRSQTHGSEDLK